MKYKPIEQKHDEGQIMFTILNPKYKIIKEKDQTLKDIVRVIAKGKYQVFIDVGSYLSSYTIEDFIAEMAEQYPDVIVWYCNAS